MTGLLCDADEIIQLTEPNAGGYGDPLDREPQLVLDDVLDDFTTVELAREAYGVVISKALMIDEAATEELRRRLRGERGDDFQGELLSLVSTPHPLAMSPHARDVTDDAVWGLRARDGRAGRPSRRRGRRLPEGVHDRRPRHGRIGR